MKLTLMERFTTIDMLPKKSDFILLKQFRELKEKLSLKPEEIKEYEVKMDNGSVSWNQLLDVGKEFEFSEVEIDIISKELRILDEKKSLEDKHFSLFEKFVNNKKN